MDQKNHEPFLSIIIYLIFIYLFILFFIYFLFFYFYFLFFWGGGIIHLVYMAIVDLIQMKEDDEKKIKHINPGRVRK